MSSSAAISAARPSPVQPATPTILPPTPRRAGRESSEYGYEDGEDEEEDEEVRPSVDLNGSAEEGVAGKRRSIFRSPGTASSPDLATLLRKAKERGGVVGSSTSATLTNGDAGNDSLRTSTSRDRDRDRESFEHPPQPPPPLLPPVTSNGRSPARPRSATSTSPSRSTQPPPPPPPPSSTHANTLNARNLTISTSDANLGRLAGPRSAMSFRRSHGNIHGEGIAGGASAQGPVEWLQREGSTKSTKSTTASTMRSRTSNFFGKLMGTSKQRPPLPSAPPPPVPALPPQYSTPPRSSQPGPDPPRPSTASAASASPRPSMSKPLPPIMTPQHALPQLGARRQRPSTSSEASVERALFSSPSLHPLQPPPPQPLPPVVTPTTRPALPAPRFSSSTSTTTPTTSSSTPSTANPRRRSMSVSDLDWQQFLRDEPPPASTSPNTSAGTSRPGMHAATASVPSTAKSFMTAEEGEESRVATPREGVDEHGEAEEDTEGEAGRTSTRIMETPTQLVPTTPTPKPPAPVRTISASATLPTRSQTVPAPDSSKQLSFIVSSPPPPSPAAHALTSASAPSLALPHPHPHHSPSLRPDPSTDSLLLLPQDARAHDLARKCFADDASFLPRDRVAEWLGGTAPLNRLALRHYLDFFDFADMRLDGAFRRLCARLWLKAETQQLDRILERFAGRYWQCNPGCIFGSSGVVHQIAYSLLLLNTDLHIADLSSHMSRSQFVRNTLDTIQRPPAASTRASSVDLARAAAAGEEGGHAAWRSMHRSDTAPALGMGIGMGMGANGNGNGSLSEVRLRQTESQVSVDSVAGNKGWESEMEALLKEMYNSVKSQQILQPLGNSNLNLALPTTPHRRPSQRTPPTERDRVNTLKRGSIRGLHQLLGAQSPYGSTSSVDGRLSPAPSFATTDTQTNFGSGSTLFTPTLGFASNLSHTIIKESLGEDDARSTASAGTGSTADDITDEELALFGPPWAKEGMLCRKQYWEATAKRAKSKDWKDVFVVIQKGELRMFVFGEGGTSSVHSGVSVGGGNWLSNAQQVGNVSLSHSLAHVLPPPGYNRSRPHCCVLTLSSGAVYFFQAGTEDLVNEWVSTCNYWAARQSKEPLQGGVSNMEYGWNRVQPSAFGSCSSSEDHEHDNNNYDRVSVRSGKAPSSMRMGVSPYAERDRTLINEWKPPMAPSVPSPLDEEAQLEALQKHVKTLQGDMEAHSALKDPMLALYPPRTSSYQRALGNWERKSQYLLSEVVKYTSYVESLRMAMALRLKKQGERAMERALAKSTTAIGDLVPPPLARKGSAAPPGTGVETIQEVPEPTTPARAEFLEKPGHKRESAEAGP